MPSGSITDDLRASRPGEFVKTLSIQWTAESAGASSGQVDQYTINEVNGTVMDAVTIPDASDPPTTYTLELLVNEINGANGLDLLQTNGSGRSPTVTQRLLVMDKVTIAGDIFGAHPTIDGVIRVKITGAGPGGKGTILIHYR